MNLGVVEINEESQLLMKLFLMQSFCIKTYENKSNQEEYDEILFNSIAVNSKIWGSIGRDKFVQDYK